MIFFKNKNKKNKNNIIDLTKNQNKEIKKLSNEDESKNMILSQNIKTNLNIRETFLNNNALVIGGPGTGKNRCVIEPNILKTNCSYIVTDVNGEILKNTGTTLQEHGYTIKVLNLKEPEYSCRYNPFKYLKKEADILSFVDCIINSTNNNSISAGDNFFEKTEKTLLNAIIFYIHYEYQKRPEKQNMRQVMEMLSLTKVNEQKPDVKSQLDLMFDKLPINHIAKKYYNTFKNNTIRTRQTVLTSLLVRLSIFNNKAIENLTYKDELNIEEIGKRPTALFIIINPIDDYLNLLLSVCVNQIFRTLINEANNFAYKWSIKYNNMVSLESKIFKNEIEKEIQKNELEKLQEKYLNAELMAENPEDDKFKTVDEQTGMIPVPKVWLKNPDGTILKEFQTIQEARLFLNCTKYGELFTCSISLPMQVNFIMNEFQNIGKIQNIDKILSTIRKYNIFTTISIQNISQLENLYKNEAYTIMKNCDKYIYLSPMDIKTNEVLIKILNPQTEDEINKIGNLDKNKCIILIPGQKPFIDYKYEINKDIKEKISENQYDVKRYFSTINFQKIQNEDSEKYYEDYKKTEAYKKEEKIFKELEKGMISFNNLAKEIKNK